MKVLLSAILVFVSVGAFAGPAKPTATLVGGGCESPDATNVSDKLCDPDAPSQDGCNGITYESCHTTSGLSLDMACVDDQINVPCNNCGSNKDADYEYCTETD